MDLLQTPEMWTALLSGIVAVAFSLTVMWLSRHLLLLVGGEGSPRLAAQMQSCLGIIHALILAFVFADSQAEYADMREQVAEEATAVAHLYFDLKLYGAPETEPLRRMVANYLEEVLDREWPRLADNRLSRRAWALFDDTYAGILDLAPSSARQEVLRQRMLSNIWKVSDFRQARLFESQNRLPEVFWFIAMFGFVLILMLSAAYPLRRGNLVFVGSYSLFFGAVSYLIFAFQDPFDGRLSVQPTPFAVVYEDTMVAPAGSTMEPSGAR